MDKETIQEITKVVKSPISDSMKRSAINSILRERDQKSYPGAVNRAEVKKIAKEMYLEVANMDIDATTISDCISCTASKCREVLERKLRALPLATLAHKKGKWIRRENINGLEQYYQCSNCGNHCLYEYVEIGFKNAKTKYCPSCGAEMEVEE